MYRKYKKTDGLNSSNCGFYIELVGRDLYLVFLKLLNDDKFQKWKLLSKKGYRTIVVDCYKVIEKEYNF